MGPTNMKSKAGLVVMILRAYHMHFTSFFMIRYYFSCCSDTHTHPAARAVLCAVLRRFLLTRVGALSYATCRRSRPLSSSFRPFRQELKISALAFFVVRFDFVFKSANDELSKRVVLAAG